MLTYTYDGTLEGLLCCIFVIYERHEVPDEIVEEPQLQFSFDQHCARSRRALSRPTGSGAGSGDAWDRARN